MNTNIQSVSDALLCSSCGACRAICPQDAISFEYSSLGRKFANVSHSTCINCGLCTKVCPTIDTLELHKRYEDIYIGKISNVYIGRATDDGIYKNAQSGGGVSALLSYLFNTKKIEAALVCRVEQGEKSLTPQGVIIESADQLFSTQKSCYTPVDILSCLKGPLSYSSMAIVGLPCHIQGAMHLIASSNRFSQIKYKIGLICDRTMCAGIQDVIASRVEESISKIIWRKKDFIFDETYYSYELAPVVAKGESGKEYVISRDDRMALKELFTPPRCRVCYDKLNTHADVVLGDPWGMSGFDKSKGDNVIIVRTSKGQELIDYAQREKYVTISPRPISEVISGQGIRNRRQVVKKYSNALKFLPNKCSSYLYGMEKMKLFDMLGVIKCYKKLKQFIVNDSLEKRDILHRANKQILEYRKKHIQS